MDIRGFCFQLSEETQEIKEEPLTVRKLAPEYGALGLLYAEELTEEDLSDMRGNFLKAMEGIGCGTGEESLPDGTQIPYAVFTPGTQKRYFIGAYRCLKQTVEDLTLEEFCSDISRLMGLIMDEHDDAVWCDGYARPLDLFMRQVDFGRKYYLGNILALVE